MAWSGEAYRATSYDVPLWVDDNRRSGRWNVAHQGSTQYLCLNAEAPLAEALRHEDLRTEPEAALYRTTVWQLQLEEGAIVDYGTFEKAEVAGLPAAALVDDDHARCQAEANWLQGHGVRGLLSPSAALPGSTNLTLFGPRVALNWGATVKLGSTIRAQRLTTGAPPAGLVARTRYFDDPHSLLEEHLALVRHKSRKRK